MIRMSAVENEDNKVADMIHSLSAQFKIENISINSSSYLFLRN